MGKLKAMLFYRAQLKKLSLHLSHLQTWPIQWESLKILHFFQDNFLSLFQAAVQTTLSVTSRRSNTPNYFNHYLLTALTCHRINYASAYQNNLLFDRASQYLQCKSSLLHPKSLHSLDSLGYTSCNNIRWHRSCSAPSPFAEVAWFNFTGTFGLGCLCSYTNNIYKSGNCPLKYLRAIVLTKIFNFPVCLLLMQ